jgi:hypothetical protein
MGWAERAVLGSDALLLVLWVRLATVGPGAGWRRVDLAWLLSVLLVGAGIVQQKATTIELVRTRGI